MPKVLLGILAAVTALTACGLRGGLQRPDPIFRDVPPVEQTVEEEVVNEEPVIEGPSFNEFGGEIPDTAPVEPVTESAIDDASADE
ncbi:MAG: lipoprotein [Pseudomonadota bacterium]